MLLPAHISTIEDYLIKFQKTRTVIDSARVTMTEFQILLLLAQANSSLKFYTTSDIVKELGMDRGWIYQSVRTLIEKGFVEKDTNGILNTTVEGNLLLIRL